MLKPARVVIVPTYRPARIVLSVTAESSKSEFTRPARQALNISPVEAVARESRHNFRLEPFRRRHIGARLAHPP